MKVAGFCGETGGYVVDKQGIISGLYGTGLMWIMWIKLWINRWITRFGGKWRIIGRIRPDIDAVMWTEMWIRCRKSRMHKAGIREYS